MSRIDLITVQCDDFSVISMSKLLILCEGNPNVTGVFPDLKTAVMRSSDVFVVVSMNKLLQSMGNRLIETSCHLCGVTVISKFAFHFSVSVSVSTLVRPASRLAMPAGSSTVWSMASSRMDRCPATRPSAVVMTPSTRSSVRPAPENMCPGLSSWTSSQQLSVNNLNEIYCVLALHIISPH